jgi:hypothetical protein
MSMDDLRSQCARMKELQGQKDKLETELTDINKELDLIRTKKIPELMESMELRNVTIEGLGRVQLAADIYASTREGQKETAMTWLRDCGYDNMITETYNASSLKALFRRMISEGVDIPDDIFNIQPFIRASIVKA